MNERQDNDRGDADERVPPEPAEEREPVTHSLKGSMTIDLNLPREEEDDG
jgi:hypothetical protein